MKKTSHYKLNCLNLFQKFSNSKPRITMANIKQYEDRLLDLQYHCLMKGKYLSNYQMQFEPKDEG